MPSADAVARVRPSGANAAFAGPGPRAGREGRDRPARRRVPDVDVVHPAAPERVLRPVDEEPPVRGEGPTVHRLHAPVPEGRRPVAADRQRLAVGRERRPPGRAEGHGAEPQVVRRP